MKKICLFLVVIIAAGLLFSCGNSEEENKQKLVKLLTSKTLGLAYLEEFKLEEAEQEFKNFIELAPKEKLGYANLGLTYLRMGKYDEAEEQLFEAIDIDSKDADIRLLLANVYLMKEEKDKALEQLQEAYSFDPENVKVLYNLAEIYSTDNKDDSGEKYQEYTQKLANIAEGNIVPQLNLTDIFIKNGDADKAVQQLETIKQQFPEFPKEAISYYEQTLILLKKNEIDQAIIQFTIFHNYLKVTSTYQAGMTELKGPGGAVVGFPLIVYDQQSKLQALGDKSLLEVIKFTDVTKSSGLEIISKYSTESDKSKVKTHVETADFDADGDIDIYAGCYDATSNSYKHFLFNDEMGRFNDIADEVGMSHSGKETSAKFIDFDNDGFLDLYITREDGDLLYKNVEKGVFEDITDDAEIGSKTGGEKSVFFDLDHDGDLDLFETTNGENLVYRNNGDGTFVSYAKQMNLAGDGDRATASAFGDFDDDGDIDLIVGYEKSGIAFYSNMRQSRFEDIAEQAGLKVTGGVSSLAVGDYNNDGFLDLFVAENNGTVFNFYKNLGDKFQLVQESKDIFGAMNMKAYDSEFFDFDNDGLLDILIVGKSKTAGERGIFLYHNDGEGKFSDVSSLLPRNKKEGRQISLFDYNDDGDMDLLIVGFDGGISLLRNDGGNINHYVKMKLVGLRTGSAKNNYFGIGAKVEIRAGELYQTMVVTDPNVHFGLGERTQADVIRITWTNGVPQNIFLPNADQDLIEAQTLKGSCPFLYAWNGEKYVFVKDIIWRSALGMPLGIMGGETKYGFADASDDYIKIPGDVIKPQDGKYTIQVTSELWETIYIDKLSLVAVDHPENIDVYVPEQFTPPPFPGAAIYQVKNKFNPVSAIDNDDKDVLDIIRERDDNYLSGFIPDEYQGVTKMHDLVLDPGNVAELDNLHIFLYGWIFPTDASINYAIAQSNELQVLPPHLQVINEKGEWETVIDYLGFPMGKDKMVIADLTDKFLTSDHRIRIRSNMEVYWDEVFFSDCSSNEPIVSTTLDPIEADIHYRGFSRSYRKGSRYGPHWFDYYDVDTAPKWRDLTGNYTRYGDVLPLLMESDSKYIISNAGDETTVSYDASQLPELKPGWKRDFLIHNVGWVKDGDLNTALGQTVAPLPYHGMKSYPPSETDIYPSDQGLKKYNQEYNTRVVNGEDYRNVLKNMN
ncbi:FG-GAP-like repeat-containing protein [Sunxiuqinia sp. A32]|uniref:FG-GAP-like repeat-containing protein n=1 Tax=Sunxiuqinia sp. A32 TaxID=3461496 RepID=UPI004045B069